MQVHVKVKVKVFKGMYTYSILGDSTSFCVAADIFMIG